MSPIPNPQAAAVDALSQAWEDMNAFAHPGQGSGETTGHPLHEVHSHCPGMAQHALVLGPSGHVEPDPIESAQSSQPVNPTVQSDPSQKSDKSESTRMAPRASAIKEQGFSRSGSKN